MTVLPGKGRAELNLARPMCALPSRGVRIVAVAVTLPDSAVATVDQEFHAIALCSRTSLLDSLSLRIGEAGNTFRLLTTPGPAIPVGNHMNGLCHRVSLLLQPSKCLTPARETGTL